MTNVSTTPAVIPPTNTAQKLVVASDTVTASNNEVQKFVVIHQGRAFPMVEGKLPVTLKRMEV